MRNWFYVASVVIISLSARADVLTIPASIDSFHTVSTGTSVAPIPLPAGFFGTVDGVPSDMLTTPKMFFESGPNNCPEEAVHDVLLASPMEGGAIGVHDTNSSLLLSGKCDTQVQRLSTVSLPMKGDSGSTPLQIQFLSLKSVSPLSVFYGGAHENLFDVLVDLAPGPQDVGTMTLTRTGPQNGVFDSTLPVRFRLTFVNENPSGPAAVTQPVLSDVLSSSNTPFVVVPEPSFLPPVALVLPVLIAAAPIYASAGRRRPKAT